MLYDARITHFNIITDEMMRVFFKNQRRVTRRSREISRAALREIAYAQRRGVSFYRKFSTPGRKGSRASNRATVRRKLSSFNERIEIEKAERTLPPLSLSLDLGILSLAQVN